MKIGRVGPTISKGAVKDGMPTLARDCIETSGIH